MIYFDNAATTGHKPQKVISSVDFALRSLSANPGRSGHFPSQRAATTVYNARKSVANFFGCENVENVVFTPNCTASINYVLKGVLTEKDHIVISDLEHNAVMRPLKALNVEFTVAEVSLTDDNDTLQNFKKAIKPNTKMIFCTAASNVLGKILPIKKIGDLCSQNKILFGVDAAQAAGVINIDMSHMNIDFLCIAAHKGLYCPMGLGILIARSPIKNTIIEGGTGTESTDFIQPETMPEMLESGTINLPAIASVTPGIEFVKEHFSCILKYENELVKRFYLSLKNEDIIFYTNPLEGAFVPVLSFNVAKIPSEKVASVLSQNGFALRGGLHCAPTAHKKIGTTDIGTVRFSPSIFNTAKEVELLVNRLKNFKKYKKHY